MTVHMPFSLHQQDQTFAISELDWNQLWKDAHQRCNKQKNQKQYWNRRAHSFAHHGERSAYVDDFIRRLAPDPAWSILDVGCGAGTLALPLATKVRAITAIDFSETMLALLQEQCRKIGISNIQTRNIAWEDDWDAAGIKRHDVVIASRSLVTYDLHAALTKLNARARKQVVITSIVGNGPIDPRIFAALGREIVQRPDYIYLCNQLYRMRILAKVDFIVNQGDDRTYENIDEAITSTRWLIPDLTDKEIPLLVSFFRKHLIPADNGWKMREPHIIRWAYISWIK